VIRTCENHYCSENTVINDTFLHPRFVQGFAILSQRIKNEMESACLHPSKIRVSDYNATLTRINSGGLCSALNCNNRSDSSNGISTHRFPSRRTVFLENGLGLLRSTIGSMFWKRFQLIELSRPYLKRIYSGWSRVNYNRTLEFLKDLGKHFPFHFLFVDSK
jgi:hypothetical protein